MTDRTETVKLIDGSEKEITVGLLSLEKKNTIFKDCLKFGIKNNGSIDVQEINYFGLITEVLKATLRDVKVSEITDEDGNKIFNKYFGDLLSGIGGKKSGN